MTGEEADDPLFIVGFPRSGTTLMRALLSAHPTIAIAPETHFLNKFAKGVEGLDLKTAANFQLFWGRFSRSDRFVDLGIDADVPRERILATGDFHLRNVFALTLQEFARAAGKPRVGHLRIPESVLYQIPHDRIPLFEFLRVALLVLRKPHPDSVLAKSFAKQSAAEVAAANDRIRSFQLCASDAG